MLASAAKSLRIELGVQETSESECPGFGWDRVNFHKKPGRNTAGLADPDWPNKQGIQYHVTSCSVGSGGAGWEEVNRCWRERWVLGDESCSVYSLVFLYSCYLYYCCYCPLPLLFC